MTLSRKRSILTIACCIFSFISTVKAQTHKPLFRVIAFYTGKDDPAHISFVKEANHWFSEKAGRYHFIYDSTNDWNNLNRNFLTQYQLIIFLDSRPEIKEQREAFKEYMENGGAWMGFHYAGFALTPSDVNQNWNWYHERFLGSGEYLSNTWRPTTAILRVEKDRYQLTKGLPSTFTSAANEWYRWSNDLRKNKDIEIILSIDSTSFPLGTGPKPQEIWHSGYYPVVWTNVNYKMVYLNMGHNDMDYEKGTQQTLSSSFNSPGQNQLILNSVMWLAAKKQSAYKNRKTGKGKPIRNQ